MFPFQQPMSGKQFAGRIGMQPSTCHTGINSLPEKIILRRIYQLYPQRRIHRRDIHQIQLRHISVQTLPLTKNREKKR